MGRFVFVDCLRGFLTCPVHLLQCFSDGFLYVCLDIAGREVHLLHQLANYSIDLTPHVFLSRHLFFPVLNCSVRLKGLTGRPVASNQSVLNRDQRSTRSPFRSQGCARLASRVPSLWAAMLWSRLWISSPTVRSCWTT